MIAALIKKSQPTNLCTQLTPFHLNEAFHNFSLACPNCQDQYACDMGLLLSKAGVLKQVTATIQMLTNRTTQCLMGG